jgi:Uma2 family endonuclease
MPISLPATKSTAEDYRALPEGPPHWQLVEGDLIQEPPPSTFHQTIAMNLSLLLGNHIRANRLGNLLAGPAGVWLSNDNVFEPDLMFVAQARRSAIATDGVHGPPDFVVEIISPRSSRRDAQQKRQIYGAAGVGEYWLIDPDRRQVAVFRFAEQSTEPVQVAVSGDVLRSAFFPGLAVAVRQIFEEP